MNVVVNGQLFDTDKLNLKDINAVNDWRSPEGKFVKELRQDVYLVTRLYDHCFDNLDELMEGIEFPPPGKTYAKNYLVDKLKTGMDLKSTGAEFFTRELLLNQPDLFLKAIGQLSSPVEITESEDTWVWNADANGDIIFDWSPNALAARKAYLEKFDKSILPIDQSKLEDLFSKPSAQKRVVCWACGSYKTTLIRQFITKHWADGIFYACSTIEEVNMLAYDIASFIGEKHVFRLHSEIDDEVYAEYEKNPEFLKWKSVVVATHARLMKDPPSVLFTQLDDPLGGDSRRKYVIIDEKPQFYSSVKLSAAQISPILGWGGDTNLNYKSAILNLRADVESNSMMKKVIAYSTVGLLGGKKVDPRKDQLIVRKTLKDELSGEVSEMVLHTLNLRRTEYAASIVLDTLRENLEKDPDYLLDDENNMFYMSLNHIKVPNLIIFDGTGDLILKDSPDWTMVKPAEASFNFKGSFNKIDTEIERRIVGNNAEHISKEFDKLIDHLVSLTTKHKKIFVVSWKSLRDNFKDTGLLDVQVDKTELVHKADITMSTDDLNGYIKLKIPVALRDRFYFTYYQSGKTRGTNQYVDSDAVVLLGSFFIPNSAIASMNAANNAKMTTDDYSMAEVIQAIYRSQIRKSKPVDVYYTSDWGDRFMYKVMDHLGVDMKDSKVQLDANASIAYFCSEFSVTKHTRNEKYIRLLATKVKDLCNGIQVEYEVPDNEHISDFKKGISNLLNNITELRFENVDSTRRFKVSLL